MQDPIALDVLATEENFTDEGYLAANPDVRSAIKDGTFPSALDHFRVFGAKERRRIKVRGNTHVAAMRAAKLEKLLPHLRSDMPSERLGDVVDFLTPALREEFHIIPTDNVSANGYNYPTQDLIARHKDGLVLDCGAGSRPLYYPNVVNYEIVAYESTDVLGVGESLPFEDNTFDAVISIAVLEHVRDPFRCANEISRVLKPGGELYCAVPFLQPLHGYPHHYFNATVQGIRRLFEDQLIVKDVTVTDDAHPAAALHWILTSWDRGLRNDVDAVSRFRAMTINEILVSTPDDLVQSVGMLPRKTLDEIACGFSLTATK